MISKRARSVKASGIRRVFDLAAKIKDPIDLSIGQPDYDVPDDLKRALREAVAAGRNRYAPTVGIAQLREAIAARTCETRGWEPEAVLVTSGVSGALTLAFLALLDPGDEILVPDPYFVSYKQLAHVAGARPVFVDTYPDFRLRPEALERAITPRTRAIMVNSPANPTGALLAREELLAAVKVARRHDLVVVADEIYEDFVYDGAFATTGGMDDKVLVLSGFSKGHAMTGWRVGFALGPGEIIDAMARLQQFTFVCAPTPAQVAAARAFELDTAPRREEYRAKRDLACELLSERFRFTRPEGAFYLFPEAPGGSGERFCEKAIQSGVLVIPGGVFSERDTHFRISYAASGDTLRRGAEALNRLAGELE